MMIKSIKLFHKNIEVRYEKEVKTKEGEVLSGMLDADGNRIFLCETLKPDDMKEVLLHELIHAIDKVMSIGLREKEVHQVSVGIAAVMRDNPKLVKELFS
jgi:hypothetical protein